MFDLHRNSIATLIAATRVVASTVAYGLVVVKSDFASLGLQSLFLSWISLASTVRDSGVTEICMVKRGAPRIIGLQLIASIIILVFPCFFGDGFARFPVSYFFAGALYLILGFSATAIKGLTFQDATSSSKIGISEIGGVLAGILSITLFSNKIIGEYLLLIFSVVSCAISFLIILVTYGNLIKICDVSPRVYASFFLRGLSSSALNAGGRVVELKFATSLTPAFGGLFSVVQKIYSNCVMVLNNSIFRKGIERALSGRAIVVPSKFRRIICALVSLCLVAEYFLMPVGTRLPYENRVGIVGLWCSVVVFASTVILLLSGNRAIAQTMKPSKKFIAIISIECIILMSIYLSDFSKIGFVIALNCTLLSAIFTANRLFSS